MDRNNKGRLGVSLAALCCSGAVLAACSSATTSSSAPGSSATVSSSSPSSAATSKKPIVIGVAVGLTGYLAADDVPFSHGVELAAKYMNSHGGMDGHKVVLHVVDMQSNAATGVTAMTQLIDQSSIDAAIGGSVSAATAAYAPLLARSSVPMIAASVLPADDQWQFSTLQPTSETDAIDLGFVASKLHLKSIGVVYSQTPYGEQASKGMAAAAAKDGISVLSTQAAQTNATDLTPQLQKIQSSGAQAIIDILTGPVHLVEAKSAANLGLKIPIVMGQDTRQIFEESTAAYANTYWTGLGAQVYPYNSNASIKAANAAFLPVYRAAYGSQSGIGNAARGWDSMQILAQAVKASGAVTGATLRNALQKVTYTGTETQYAYTASDHSGQLHVSNPLGIGQYHGSSYKIVYQGS